MDFRGFGSVVIMVLVWIVRYLGLFGLGLVCLQYLWFWLTCIGGWIDVFAGMGA